MTQYAEKFIANRKTYGLENHTDGTVKLWAGGCAIGQADDMPEARKLLHAYIKSQLRADIGSAERQLDDAQRDLNKIADDPFYLAKLLVE